MQALPAPASPEPSRARRAAFAALALALPFVALLLLEGVLRLAGVGAAWRAPFQPVPGRAEAVALDPSFGGLFFKGFRPGVAFDPVTARKAPGTLRVMALGGSTTAGFPYHWYYGFPARLEDRLADALPGRRVELANLGMTATNSYTVWALAPAVAAQQPDAVVLYTGHNEYYGAYGTGSAQGWGGTSVPLKRALIGVSRWATVAGARGLLERGGPPPEEGRTMMARVIRDAAIAPGSAAYVAGIEQYEANLSAALEVFGRAGIPVFLATLTSNLGGQAPLGESPAALEAYARGEALLARGDTAAARTAFLEAKEADGLRFRAPEAMNGVVRRLAARFEHVTLVDAQQAFRDASPGGLEGDALFTDHLHPNARGYALLADAFADSMAAVLPTMRTGQPMRAAPATLDPVEEGAARLQLTALLSGYPFRKDRTPEQAQAAARAEASAMLASGRAADALAVRTVVDGMPAANALNSAVQDALARRDTLAALQLYGALVHWQPFNTPLMERATALALQSPRYDAETAALARYARQHSDGLFGTRALAAVALRQGELGRAEALLAQIEEREPESPELFYNRARLAILQGDTAQARAYFARYSAAAQR